MVQKKHVLLILLLMPLLLSMSPAEETHSSNSIEFIGKVVNFVLLFGTLIYVLRKPIRNFLQQRAQNIERTIKEAEDSKLDAEKTLKEGKTRLETLAEEIEKIKAKAEEQGRAEKERIKQAARREVARIKHFAKQEIEMLSIAGVKDLKEYTAELATALAQERIQRKMTPEIQSFLIDKSIKKLERLYEKSSADKKIHARVK